MTSEYRHLSFLLAAAENVSTDSRPLSKRLQEICGEPRRFRSRPSQNLVEEFAQFRKVSGAPEFFPGLSWRRPGRHEVIKVLVRFSQGRTSRRLIEMIPCAVCCRDAGKFLDGYLAWSETTGEIFLIGHDCGDGHFDGETWRSAKHEYDEEQRLARDLDALGLMLPYVGVARQALDRLRPAVDYLARAMEKWSQESPRSLAILHKAVGNKGSMRLVHLFERQSDGPRGFRKEGSRLAEDDDDRDLDVVHKVFGRLAGASVLDPSTRERLHDGMHKIDKLIAGIPSDLLDPEVAALWVCDQLTENQTDAQQVGRIRSRVDSARSLYAQIVKDLEAGARFFLPANLQRLAKWSAHPDNETSLAVSLSARAVFVGLRGAPDSSGRTRMIERVCIELPNPSIWVEPAPWPIPAG